MQIDNKNYSSITNENLDEIKYLKIKTAISQIIYAKNTPGKSNRWWVIALVYNIFITLISFIGFVPIAMHISNPNFKEPSALGVYYIFVIFFCAIYIIDFALRMFTIQIYYETVSYKKALKKQLNSIYSNYQVLSAIIIIVLICVYGSIQEGFISFGNEKLGTNNHFNNDIAMLVFSIMFLLNVNQFFPRILVYRINQENYKACKRIIYTKRYTFFFAFLIMFGVWLIFSYILFMFEKAPQVGTAGVVEANQITTIGDAMYFTFTTMTTVGLGDFVPHTHGGKVMTVIIAIFGVIFYGYIGSIFVNIYIEYINKKKQMRTEVINQKVKESENKKLLKDINEIVLKNLHLSGVINEKKYQELLEKSSEDENVKHIYTMNDFSFDEENKKILFHDMQLGKKVRDKKVIHEALAHNWLALMNKPVSTANIHAVLNRLPSTFIDKIKEADCMPIIFTSKFIDENVQKVIAFRKKTLKSAVLEINVQGSMTFEKENAWAMFGMYTKMSKNKFDNIFKKAETINVLIVKDILIYDHYKPLEAFGINTNGKVEDVYYLK